MGKRLFRTVLDTNIILSSRSKNINSPNVEVVELWKSRKFILLFSDDVLIEYIEKLADKGMNDDDIVEFTNTVLNMGEYVEIGFFHLQYYPTDQDDIAFVLCAENGNADFLVSYDNHLLRLNELFVFKICRPLTFLSELRKFPPNFQP